VQDSVECKVDVYVNIIPQYVQQLDVSSLDLFDVFQGIQFLPLDKYIYLKIHCFINQVETTFRLAKPIRVGVEVFCMTN